MKSCIYDIFDDINESKYPGFKKTIWLECIQESNEIIFVPSGWYHQVHNLDDTISINHNWFNGYNLSFVWDLLLKDYKEAKEYIEDIKDICDDFESICQRNLAANTGMNLYDFFIFISRFSLANVVQLYFLRDNKTCGSLKSDWSLLARNYALNLASVQKIALKMETEAGLAGTYGLLDLRELVDDPQFVELCTSLGKTYAAIYKQENWSCGTKEVLMAAFEDQKYKICTPNDLVKFIDSAVAELGCSCAEEIASIFVPDDVKPLQGS